MAYPCKSGECDNNPGGFCPVAQRFSNDQFLFNDKPIGSALHDNARKINEVRKTVAAFKPTADTVRPFKCDPLHDHFKLVLVLDNYPQETTWQIVNSAGLQVASGGPYDETTQKGAEIVHEQCLPDTPHDFIISDTYFDGICCGWGQGSYKLYWGGALAASGGMFSETDSKTVGGCANYNGWYDSYGDDCSWYEDNESPGCPYWGNTADAGYGTPDEACCHCDGGLEI